MKEADRKERQRGVYADGCFDFLEEWEKKSRRPAPSTLCLSGIFPFNFLNVCLALTLLHNHHC